MSKIRRCIALSAVLLAVPCAPLRAQTPEAPNDLSQVREEIAALRERLAALEARLPGLQPPAAAPAAEPPPPPPTPLPASTSGLASSKVFNPDIAVVGNFLGTVGKSPGGGEPSLELHEAEASFQAAIDPYAKGDFFFAFGPEGAEIEEGTISFPTLPGGFLLKVGKQRASFGKVNQAHAHALAWTDRPLVTQNLVGGEEGLSDAGLSLSRLLPNKLLFLEATAEVYRGQNEVFTGEQRGDLTYVGRLRGYRDLSESTNLDLGASGAWGHEARATGHASRLLGLDATLRWRPLRRAIYHRFLARTELVWSRRDLLEGSQSAFGMYASAEYQFARRWFAGARFDSSERATEPGLRDRGASALLTFWPSEFSQVRAQYRHTRFGEGRRANELLFQFLFSIGAHGAHAF